MLAPIVRSDTVGRLLAELLLRPDDEVSFADLQRATGAQPAVVHREIVRFIEAGLVTARRVGRGRHVKVALDYPLLRPLTELITLTYGPVPVVRDALTEIADVDQAVIYGSWAARLNGEPGPFPRDLDVLVIGETPRSVLHDVAQQASDRLRLDVNITRVSAQAWADRTDPFIVTIRSRPIVTIINHDSTGTSTNGRS